MDLLLSNDPAAAGDEGSLLLSSDWTVLAAAAASGRPARALDDLIPAEDAAALDAASWNVSGRWFFDAEGDVTAFQGVSLGVCERFHFWTLHSLPAFKFAAALAAAVESERPRRVSYDPSLGDAQVSVLESARGRWPAVEFVRKSSTARAATSLSWAAPRVTRPPLKRLAARAANALSRGAGKPPLVAFYYPAHEELLSALAERFQVTLAEGPGRAHAAWALRARPRHIVDAFGPARWTKGASPAPRARARWHELRARPLARGAASWSGLALDDALRPACDRFFESSFEALAWASASLGREWDRRPPALVLAPSDAPPLQRLLLDLASSRGIPTSIVLHGLPYRYGPENLATDALVVWGPGLEEGYRAAGFRGRCLALGSAVLEAARSGRETRGSGILVLTHPVNGVSALACSVDTERYATAVVRALEGAAAVLKLHPSESLGYYQRLLAGAPGVSITRSGALSRHFASSRLVVGSFSTAMLEAIAHGLPVVCVNMTRDRFPAPFDGGWGIPIARTEEDLRRELRAFRADPDAWTRERTSHYPRILKEFAGPLDGRSVERVCAALGGLTARAKETTIHDG